MKSGLKLFLKLSFTFYIYIIISLYFSLNKIHLQVYKRCFSIRSCSQTRPGIWSQTRPGISLCCLSGLSLQGRGQFLVLLNQSEQDQESLSALALDCLCQTGLTPWSVSLPFHRTILLFLLLCKILFPGLVGALHQGTKPRDRRPRPRAMRDRAKGVHELAGDPAPTTVLHFFMGDVQRS